MSATADTLAALKQSTRDRRRADAAYRSALLAAFDELERAGARTPYATIARAAGVSKRQVRETVKRARASRCTTLPTYDLLAQRDAAAPPGRTTHGRRLLGLPHLGGGTWGRREAGGNLAPYATK